MSSKKSLDFLLDISIKLMVDLNNNKGRSIHESQKSKVKRKVDEYQIQETPSFKDNHLRFNIVKKTPQTKEEKPPMEVLEFKIHPTKEQITEINRSFAACKLLWNLSIALKEESTQRYYRKKHKFKEKVNLIYFLIKTIDK